MPGPQKKDSDVLDESEIGDETLGEEGIVSWCPSLDLSIKYPVIFMTNVTYRDDRELWGLLWTVWCSVNEMM